MKKENNYIKQRIEVLDLDKDVLDLLKMNSINLVEDLWKNKKTDLKEMGLNDKDIKYISIKMQLLGLDLNKKIY